MSFALSLVLGWISFWALYGTWTWIFHTELDFWALALILVPHLALHLLLATDPLAWFVIGPLVGGVWLTLRAALRGPGRELVRRRPLRTAATVATTGLLDLLVTTGAVIPLLGGALYTAAAALLG